MYEDMPDPSSSKIARELLNEERDLYAHFHPVFTAIAPKEKVEAFNALRNDVSSKKISQEDAYLQVVPCWILTLTNNFRGYAAQYCIPSILI